MRIREFIREQFRHFNAAALADAARDYEEHLEQGGRMMLALAGAMSTAEIGRSLAEMIRRDKVHAICCTGANLEEDVFNLLAHERYERLPDYRDLTPQREAELRDRGLARVTDTAIPEEEAIKPIEQALLARWRDAEAAGERRFPHEFFYDALLNDDLVSRAQIDPKHCWVLAAAEKNLPMYVPGWEDSTMGNVFAANLIKGELRSPQTIRSGVEYMTDLAAWYTEQAGRAPVGFFQIGGGIAGDFAICVAPMLRLDLGRETPRWRYFCQISDSTTSYGSYSGAVPSEKITWNKLEADSRRHIIESDATIVAPLIFAHVLGW